MEMRVFVANLGVLDSPEIALVRTLVGLGHDVTVAGYDLDRLPDELKSVGLVRLHDLGTRSAGPSRVVENARSRRAVREWLTRDGDHFDLVWTTNEITVRDLGDLLLDKPHVMQLYELCEYVPLVGRRSMPLHSGRTIDLARRAACVVVPEPNRAAIQQAWWDLPVLPAVLPNRPHSELAPSPEAEAAAAQLFAGEDRRVVLYQGIFSAERQLEPFADAVRLLGGSHVLYLMGEPHSPRETGYLRGLTALGDHVRYVGHQPSPDHLAFTKRAHLGVLVYVPQKVEYVSELNGLYCAPNKVWEYAGAGLPMVSNELPGLAADFGRFGMGATSSLDPASIAEAISRLEERYDDASAGARRFFESIDMTQLIEGILERAVAAGPGRTRHGHE